MSPALRDSRVQRLGYGLLAFLFVVLAYRCERAVTAVMRPSQEIDSATGPYGDGRAYAALAARDSLIAQALPAQRDPFQPAREPVAPAVRPDRTSPQAATPPPPVLRALLYDRDHPLIKLEVDGSVSDWLDQGYVFKGWTIVRITATTVEVHDKDRTLTLRAH